MTKLPPAPTYFHKPVTALNSHQGAVVRPEGCKWLNYEGEIVIVMGRTCRNVAPDEAGDYIAGYTIGNDFGLHDFRDTDAGSMLRVKGSDTLAPVGPGLVAGWDFHGKTLRTLVNGQVVQEGSTDEMEWDMHYLVADLARTITLQPGRPALHRHPGQLPAGRARGRRRGRGRGPREAHATTRRGPAPDPRRRRRPAERERGGREHGARRRLGVPRRADAVQEPLPEHSGPDRRGAGMIRVVVDREICQDHGQCVFAAPQVFELDEEGKLDVLQDEVDESLRANVEEAADVCPVQAITIEG